MTGISTLGQALDQIERLKDVQIQFGSLTAQMTTGKISQDFLGLGSNAVVSKRARADFKSLDVYVNNIKNAERRIELSMNALTTFKKQAENFSAALVAFGQQSSHQQGEPVYYDDPLTAEDEHVLIGYTSANPDVDLANLQRLASSIYDIVIDMVNQQDGDRYLFSGAETLSKPLTDSGTLDSMMNSLLSSWKGGTLDTDDLISGLRSSDASTDPNAVTDSIIGYSAALSTGAAGNVFVRADTATEIDYTVHANDGPLRDIIVAASFFKNDSLTPVADQVDPDTYAVLTPGAPGDNVDEMRTNFNQVFDALTQTVNRAIDDIDQLRYRLADAKGRIGELKQRHADSKNVLLTTISDVEDVDTSEVAVKMNALKVQIDASYQVTAMLMSVSLINFLNG